MTEHLSIRIPPGYGSVQSNPDGGFQVLIPVSSLPDYSDLSREFIALGSVRGTRAILNTASARSTAGGNDVAASDKLRALEFTKDGTAKNPDSMYDLLAALPQLLAVVEAAEAAERALEDAERIIESHSGKDSWVGSLNLAKVRAALTALDEALS